MILDARKSKAFYVHQTLCSGNIVNISQLHVINEIFFLMIIAHLDELPLDVIFNYIKKSDKLAPNISLIASLTIKKQHLSPHVMAKQITVLQLN